MHQRMNSSENMAAADGEDGEAGGVQMNPIQAGIASGKPSSAYMESMRRARASPEWQDTRISSSHPTLVAQNTIGSKTKIAILFFILLGIGLFTAGGHIYWSGDYGEDQKQTGIDLLACSSIPLVPGMYGLVKWIGVANNWTGYTSIGFSYD
jgi:hypothetical protein